MQEPEIVGHGLELDVGRVLLAAECVRDLEGIGDSPILEAMAA